MAKDGTCCSSDSEHLGPEGKSVPIGLAGVCPECGNPGKKVDGQAVKSNLAVSLRRVVEDAYRFCSAEGCTVVYYSSDGLSVFRLDEVRERVYQKNPEDDDVLVCYCFQHSVGAMRYAAPEERAAIADDITLGTKIGQCACELRNPQGTCCLGNVHELIQRLRQSEVASSSAYGSTA